MLSFTKEDYKNANLENEYKVRDVFSSVRIRKKKPIFIWNFKLEYGFSCQSQRYLGVERPQRHVSLLRHVPQHQRRTSITSRTNTVSPTSFATTSTAAATSTASTTVTFTTTHERRDVPDLIGDLHDPRSSPLHRLSVVGRWRHHQDWGWPRAPLCRLRRQVLRQTLRTVHLWR